MPTVGRLSAPPGQGWRPGGWSWIRITVRVATRRGERVKAVHDTQRVVAFTGPQIVLGVAAELRGGRLRLVVRLLVRVGVRAGEEPGQGGVGRRLGGPFGEELGERVDVGRLAR